jgi:hypothetical protein
MTRISLILSAFALLAACDPAQMADKVGRRTAETVVQPVVGDGAATQCIVQNASADEVKTLMRDVGVVAGSSTKALIAAISARAPTQDCLRAAGVPAPVL